MKIGVVGSINMDMTVTARRIPGKGETIPGDAISCIPGGKGANQAVADARLGADVTMFGCVGNDDHGKILVTLTFSVVAAGLSVEQFSAQAGMPKLTDVMNELETLYDGRN